MKLEYYIKKLPWLFRTFKLRERSLEKALGDLGDLAETISTLEGRIEVLEADVSTAKSDITGKQDTLEAGDNISIDGVVISATIPAE